VKKVPILIFLILFSFCNAQNLNGKIKDSLIFRKSENPIFNLKLINEKTKKELKTSTNQNGEFEFQNLENGMYKLTIQNDDYQQNEFNIDFNKNLSKTFFVEKFCKYRVNKSKVCSICKSDKNVVPIFYGLTTKKFMKKNKKKYHFAGCEISSCDPKWYCKTDKTEF